MYLYKYSGAVKRFNNVIHSNWTGYTYAVSEAKARSNLAYQFKKQYGMMPNVKIILPGKVELEVQEEKVEEMQLSFSDYLKSIGKVVTGLTSR